MILLFSGISLICSNADSDVSWLLDRTDLEGHSPDQPLLIERERPDKSSSGLPLNVCLSPRLLIKHCLELHSPASRRTLNLLANHFTNDTCSISRLQRTLIHQLVGREGAPLYNRPNISSVKDVVFEVLVCMDANFLH
nr:unnamed protein product [Spirometra erinaceieuropaei]